MHAGCIMRVLWLLLMFAPGSVAAGSGAAAKQRIAV
jgi:hypothetical protein